MLLYIVKGTLCIWKHANITVAFMTGQLQITAIW